MYRLVLAALAAAVTAVTAPPGFYSQPQRRAVLPDGRQINLACLGKGLPVIVLNGGAGLPTQAWMKLQPVLARANTVCAVDRPGYGFSDPGPMPRTAIRNADDIEAALKAAKLTPPFVLVGHSRGGYDVRQFAARYPKETAGLVLIDVNAEPALWPWATATPAADAAERKCMMAAAEGRLRPTDPDFKACGSPAPGSDLANPDKARAVMSELDNVVADGEAMAKAGRFGRLPIVVLTADVRTKGTPPDRVEAEQQGINRAHAAMAAQSRRGQQRFIEGASHIMMFDKPDVVAKAVGDVIAVSESR